MWERIKRWITKWFFTKDIVDPEYHSSRSIHCRVTKDNRKY